jgi:hypothetical protein
VTAPPAPTSALPPPAPFHLLLCGALVLYVYRVFVVGANLSLFRVVLAGWTLVVLAGLVRGRPRLTRWHAALAAVAAAIVAINAVDFAGLGAHPALRRDVLNHLVNVWFVLLLALHLRSHATVLSLFAAFVWSSVLTSAITLSSWALGALPFEGWLRAYGGAAARGLRYTGYDSYFHRATSAFYDPNFYGIYSALVVVTAIGLWLLVDRQRWLLWLAAVNVFFLSASLSRTGVAALLGTLMLALLVPWSGRRRGRRILALTAVGTCVCFVAASVVQSRPYRARAMAWWTSDASVGAADAALAAAKRARWATPAGHERLTGGISIADRFRRIENGWRVFRSAPWLGAGGAALLHPDFPPHASAHVVYLTLLARYGIVGTLVYAAFVLVPLAVLAGRRGPPADAILLTAATCLGLVFWSYDVFLGFELVYLFVGVAWGLAGLPVGAGDGRWAETRV